jgi:hypothetical protein
MMFLSAQSSTVVGNMIRYYIYIYIYIYIYVCVCVCVCEIHYYCTET